LGLFGVFERGNLGAWKALLLTNSRGSAPMNGSLLLASFGIAWVTPTFRCRKRKEPNSRGGFPVLIRIEPKRSRGSSCGLSWLAAARSDAGNLYAGCASRTDGCS
jgi:hypothetical protein